MERYFTKMELQMANEHMKRHSSSLAIREMGIKTMMMKYHYVPVRTAKIENSDNNKFCLGCRETGSLICC